MTDPDPAIIVLDPSDPQLDEYFIQENLSQAADAVTTRVPATYRNAVADVPEIREWVKTLVEAAKSGGYGPLVPVTEGPSLLLLGPTSVGKTHQAYGAIRALAVSGVYCSWEFATAADIYARLRPRPDIDSEEEYQKLARASLLVIDDWGVERATEWTAEINYRLINYRYEHMKPTLFTSNLPPEDLREIIGERIASRISQMADTVVLKGPDRRRTKP